MDPQMPKFVKGHTRQSKRMPYWLWFPIAKTLGIKLHPNDRPMLAVVLHALTLFSGGIMVLTRTWFSGYDISSHMTETDILDGIVAIVIVTLFVSMGVYAQRLAHRLFEHPKLLEMMRLHSKTIAKINAAAMAVVILAGFAVVLNLETIDYSYWYQNQANMTDQDVNPCQTVQIPLMICQFYYFSQVVFSVFFLLWNAMIGAALICVARTHTIAIRRFICQLECDAHLRDQKLREQLYCHGSHEARDSSKMYSWENAHHSSEDIKEVSPKPENSEDVLDDDNVATNHFDGQVHLELSNDAENSAENSEEIVSEDRQREKTRPSIRKRIFGSFRRLSEDQNDDIVSDENNFEPKILSDDELLHKYWKLVTATKLTSNAFQRWMCFVTVTVLFWSAIRIVYWLSHSPSLCGVLSLILPLFVLPLLASAYAEVNFQGIQVFQSIIPTKERSALFRYLYGCPIQLNVYGYPVSYGTMGTVLAAILAAFASRILLQEMNKILK